MSNMDLRVYSEQIQEELKQAEENSIQDLIQSQDELADLFTEISTSTSILTTLEDILTKFQADLGNISSEIKSLQDQSLSMSISLNNRKALSSRLDNFLRQVTISTELVNAICNSDVNEDYIGYINELREKLRYFRTDGKLTVGEHSISALSMQEVYPELKKLNYKASAKIRNFLLAHFQNLTKPKTNVQLIQESVLIKFKDLLGFLRENSQETYVELCMMYTETLSTVYQQHFKIYLANLRKLVFDCSTKHDLIVSEHMPNPNITSIHSFDLYDRVSLLETLDDTNPIVCHSAKKNNEKYYMERIFQSVARLLMDTCSFTFLFALEFFNIRPEQYQPVFGEIFSKTYQFVLDTFSQQFAYSHDLLALLFILKINQYYQRQMEKRGISIMNSFFEKVRIVVWPRLQYLLDTNIRNMENCTYLAATDISVHPVTYRFTQLTTGLHKISFGDEMFRQRIGQFKRAIIKLLQQMAQEIRDDKNRIVFLINNLDYIIDEFHQQAIPISEDFQLINNDLNELIENFIQLQLREVFSGLLDFLDSPQPDRVENIAKDFGTKWKQGIGMLDQMVKQLFANEANRRDILRRLHTQMLMHYQQFTEIVKRDVPQFSKLLVSSTAIMAEMQKALISLYVSLADVPVQCSYKDLAGVWEFTFNSNTFTADLDKQETYCGHGQPGKVLQIPPDFKFQFDDSYTERVTLNKDNTAESEKYGDGTWTMVYNEGFIVNLKERNMFTFMLYTTQDGKTYKSECNRTTQGWYRGPDPQNHENWGCFFAEKVEGFFDEEEDEEKLIIAGSELKWVNPTYMSFLQTKPNRYEDLQNYVEILNDSANSWEAAINTNFIGMTMKEVNQYMGKPINHQKIMNSKPLDLLEISSDSSSASNSRLTADMREKLRQTDSDSITAFWDISIDKIDEDDLPETWDWTDVDGKNFVAKARDQGNCGSCYAIATLSMLESRLRVLTQNEYKGKLSAEYLVTCSFYTEGCDGGYPTLLGKFIQEFNLVDEDCLPYESGHSSCQERCSPDNVKFEITVESYGDVSGFYGGSCESAIKKELRARGPLVISFQPPAEFAYYKKGVFQSTKGRDTSKEETMRDGLIDWEAVSHSVLLVGYGVETKGPNKGLKYWKALNSWGDTFGEGGFFRIRRGNDECSIESMAEYATPVILKWNRDQTQPNLFKRLEYASSLNINIS